MRDKIIILKEGIGTEFWKIICEEIDKRIEAARNQLETQSNTEMIRRLQLVIAVSRELKNLPNIVLAYASSTAKKEEGK